MLVVELWWGSTGLGTKGARERRARVTASLSGLLAAAVLRPRGEHTVGHAQSAVDVLDPRAGAHAAQGPNRAPHSLAHATSLARSTAPSPSLLSLRSVLPAGHLILIAFNLTLSPALPFALLSFVQTYRPSSKLSFHLAHSPPPPLPLSSHLLVSLLICPPTRLFYQPIDFQVSFSYSQSFSPALYFSPAAHTRSMFY
eukprot:521073-Pleurochrysis_carterae.AAC.1